MGIQPGYISTQLGHADVAVTARHYARWCGAEEYRQPMRLGSGEVPSDLLARLQSHQSPTNAETAEGGDFVTTGFFKGNWRLRQSFSEKIFSATFRMRVLAFISA